MIANPGARRPPDVRSVLVLGSSALVIGQAGEFDYSGSQAIKALREEGVRTIVLNPNIATVQTSDDLADEVYFLPVQPHYVERVIEQTRPDGLLIGFGGQTALNCGLALEDAGILTRYGIRVIGTPTTAIRTSEDRGLFRAAMQALDVAVPASETAHTMAEGVAAARTIGYPVMMRSAYSLGGLGSGFCADEAALRARLRSAFSLVPQVLIEEWLGGWKEVEYEIVRDRADNCITVCNMENIDALGIHTGESFVVAPSQTLDDHQYHTLREVALRAARSLGIIGECNIQFALDPESDAYRVIEMNARLSRSSALASKATGYPLAFVAAKLALGRTLPEIANHVTGVTACCFEPALDYVIVKAPRWDFQKFSGASSKLGSGMKSVGEVMGIGRTFEEALQKAIRMQETGRRGLIPDDDESFADLDDELASATDRRMAAIGQALLRGYSVERVAHLTQIDPWFVVRMERIARCAAALRDLPEHTELPADRLRHAKELGFSDAQIGHLTRRDPADLRHLRWSLDIRPVVKQIDTLAAEYPAETNYLYLTYHGRHNDVGPLLAKPTVLVLGSGAYRIGSSVEFDWCTVTAVRTLRRLGYATIVLNCNPETVSTDYDETDRLYFDEISLETIVEIADREHLKGVIVSFGGQTPNALVTRLHAAGVPILGTAPESIDCAETRGRFSELCDRLSVRQPEWCDASSIETALAFADRVGYPVLVRPSYVLSGAAMAVAQDAERLSGVLERAAGVSPDHPVTLTKFISGAKEIEVDGVAVNGEVVAHAISEHIENAGVHSGDATLVLPPQRTYVETVRRARRIARQVAAALDITGPFNIQFLARHNRLLLIECNVRASRSFPFASKVMGLNLVELATRALLGESVPRVESSVLELDYVGVKAPQFSFARLEGADPVLGVEMTSTGEVGCLGEDLDDALLKAMHAVGFRSPLRAALLSTGPIENKAAFLDDARQLRQNGTTLYATGGTAEFLATAGVAVVAVTWPLDDGEPNALEVIRSGGLDLVVNIPKNATERELLNDYHIRRTAVDHGVPLITNIQLARQFVQSLCYRSADTDARSWRQYLQS